MRPHKFGKLRNTSELIEFMWEKCNRMMAIAAAKNADYAGGGDPYANFRLAGGIGMAVRMSDKVSRIINFEKKQAANLAVADESIEDTAMDLANYALLYLGWRHNLKEEINESETDVAGNGPNARRRLYKSGKDRKRLNSSSQGSIGKRPKRVP